MAALTLTCPHCGQAQAIPATVVTTDTVRGIATVKLDRKAVEAHLVTCRPGPKAAEPVALPTAGPTSKELTGRIHQMLDMRAYVATGGSRACNMCGNATAAKCLQQVAEKGVPCCSACGEGNTHPAPQDTMGCAEWAAEHHKAGQ